MIIIGIFTYIITCIAAFFLAYLWHIFILGAITGNARWSILGIIPLFLIGLVIFMILPKEQK